MTIAGSKISSIGFSGAGFLGVYHLGVAACLLKHGYLLNPMERVKQDDDDRKKKQISFPPILTGVSAGVFL